MYFDYAQVVKLVKLPMTSSERKRGDDIRLAMSAALDELSMRLKSKSFLTSYTVSLAAATKETTLSGNNEDLRYIFALKIGSDENERFMEYVDVNDFLRTYSEGEAAGFANRWTQIKAAEGYPTVKFERPLLQSETLTVYYWVDITPDNVSSARSMAAIALGTQAYFYGTGTEQGSVYYSRFQDIAALARASDDFTHDPVSVQLLSKDQRLIMNCQRRLQLKRN